MKIAGQKNDGAWFRFNKWLKKLRANNPTMLTHLQNDQSLMDAYEALAGVSVDIGSQSGMSLETLFPGSTINGASLLSAHLNSGIPRSVWQGKLAWDVYDRVLDGDVYPRQAKYNESGSGFPSVIILGIDPEYPLGSGKTNDTGEVVYWPRNKEVMAAIGAVVRKRATAFRLAFRFALDIANQMHAFQGNPGGIADATKDNIV